MSQENFVTIKSSLKISIKPIRQQKLLGNILTHVNNHKSATNMYQYCISSMFDFKVQCSILVIHETRLKCVRSICARTTKLCINHLETIQNFDQYTIHLCDYYCSLHP